VNRNGAADRRLGWLAVVGGGLLALAVQVAAPVGVPLYDGVVVQEPYRFLNPTGDQAGSPGSFTESTAIEGVVPDIVAATTESPPQAQLIALEDAFELTAGATGLQVSITPIEPPAPPEGGIIAGNVYRFSVTDQAGNPLPAKPCQGCRSLLLRAPDGTGMATIKQWSNGGWIDVPTDHAGTTGLYQTNVTTLGDYAVIETPEPQPGPDPILVMGGTLVLLLLGAGAFLLLKVRQAPAAPASDTRPTRIPSKRKKPPRRPPSGRSS
jgi:hypothetical protein